MKGILEQPQVKHQGRLVHWVFMRSLLFQTLSNPECYHEFCRLLMRVKSNYQLGELIRLDDYNSFIDLVAKFTVSSLQVSDSPLSVLEAMLTWFCLFFVCLFVCCAVLAVLCEQHPLPAGILAEAGWLCSLHEEHRVSLAGQVHTRGLSHIQQ